MNSISSSETLEQHSFGSNPLKTHTPSAHESWVLSGRGKVRNVLASELEEGQGSTFQIHPSANDQEAGMPLCTRGFFGQRGRWEAERIIHTLNIHSGSAPKFTVPIKKMKKKKNLGVQKREELETLKSCLFKWWHHALQKSKTKPTKVTL